MQPLPRLRLTTPCPSSMIQGLYYRRKTHTLYVRFQNGSLYKYDNVPEVLYRRLRRSGSLGRYFNANIRGRYAYLQLDPTLARAA